MNKIKLPAGDPLEAPLQEAYANRQTVRLVLPSGREMVAIPMSAPSGVVELISSIEEEFDHLSEEGVSK